LKQRAASEIAILRRIQPLLLATAMVAVVLPLLVVTLPPLHDYPFHLARADAIAALMGQVAHATPYLQGSFALPNVAMDVVMLGLTALLPPPVSGRVFLALLLLLTLGGVAALHRVLHGRVSPWPLLAGFFLYNSIFLFGFTNYLFGVAIMLWSVAAWLALARAGWLWRLAAGSVLAVMLLFCHLMAFGLFAVVLGGLALHEALAAWHRSPREALARLLLPAVPVAAALALFVALSPTAGEAGQPIAYHGWIGWKPLMAYRTLLGANPWLDAVTLVPVVLLVAGLALARRLGVAAAMVLPLALLGATFLVMPHALFGALYADARLPVAVMLVAIAALDVRRLPPRAVALGGAALVALLAGRSVGVARDWQSFAPVHARHEAAFALLPPGAVLWAATAAPYPSLAYRSPAELALWHPPLKHVASLASVGRDVFVPSTWADPFKQPIAVPPRYQAAKALQGDNPFQTPGAAALDSVVAAIRGLRAPGEAAHDFLLLSHPAALQGTPSPGLAAIAQGPTFTLFRID